MNHKPLVRKIWYKCQGCSYQRVGKSVLEFEDLTLIKDCANCGGHFKFKCPQCGAVNKTKKIEVPDES